MKESSFDGDCSCFLSIAQKKLYAGTGNSIMVSGGENL